MEKIILSDGRELAVQTFGIDGGGGMHIRLAMPMVEAITALSSGTDRIIYDPGDGQVIAINGFTKLDYIANEQDTVRVVLSRPLDLEVLNG